jgi:ATP-binding cassette subfamily B protein
MPVEPQADRQAFARARSYLKFDSVAKWSALFAAIGTALLYVALLILLWLTSDLLVYHGQIPEFAELPPDYQDDFREGRRGWPLEADNKAPMLAALSAVGADSGRLANADRSQLNSGDWDLMWKAYVHDLLGRNVGPETSGVVPGGSNQRGILSLVVRSDGRLLGTVAAWLARRNGWMWQDGNDHYLTRLLLLAIGLALLRGLLTFAMHEMAARAAIVASTRLRRAVYHHTFRLGTLAIKALGPSEAVSIYTRHVESVHDALYVWQVVYMREPVKFGMLLVFALVLNFWLATSFLLFTLLVWLIGGQIATHYRRQGRLAAHRASEQLTLIRESLMLMRLVKVYLMELFNQSRVERLLSRYGAAQRARYRSEAISRSLLLFLGMLAALILLYVSGLVVLHDLLSVASAITLATALVSLYWPLETWLSNRRIVRRGRESSVILFKFLGRPGEVGQVVGAEFLPPLARQLELDSVSLREPGTSRILLQDISLTIQAGQRIALVGPDDLAKHALVYLIPRFLDPTSGEIRIDQHNLRWVTLDSLRAQIAVVLQHNLVFHDSVANNIGCGDSAYTLPQIIEAAKVAHAHHFIQKLPQGYETALGELGHALSVSEQFRIALARAILRDPALFIIEEPAMDLDEETKAMLDDTLARVLPGRTVIFLPHRLSTIKSCDRVFLLHKGRLEGVGEHRELILQNPLYRHLHYLEFSELADQV